MEGLKMEEEVSAQGTGEGRTVMEGKFERIIVTTDARGSGMCDKT